MEAPLHHVLKENAPPNYVSSPPKQALKAFKACAPSITPSPPSKAGQEQRQVEKENFKKNDIVQAALQHSSDLSRQCHDMLPDLFNLMKTFAAIDSDTGRAIELANERATQLNIYKSKNDLNLSKIDALQKKLQEAERRADMSEVSVERLSEDLSTQGKALSETGGRLRDLEGENNVLKGEREALVEKATSDKEMISRLEGEVGVLAEVKNKIIMENGSLLTSLQSLKSEVMVLTKELGDKCRAVDNLTKLRVEAENARISALDALETSKKERDEAVKNAEEMNQNGENLRKELERRKKEFVIKCANLEKRIVTAEEKSYEESQRASGLKEKVATKEIRILKLEGIREELEEEVRKQKKSASEKEGVINALEGRVAEMNKKVNIDRSSHESMQKRNTEEMATLNEDMGNLQKEICGFKAIIEEMKKEKVGMIKEIEEVKKELDKVTMEKERKEEELKVCKSDVDKLISEVMTKSDKTTKLESNMDAIVTELNEKEAEVLALKEKYVEARDAAAETKRVSSENQKLTAERCVEMSQRLANMTAEKSMLLNEGKVWEREKSELVEGLENGLQKNNELNRRIERMENEISEGNSLRELQELKMETYVGKIEKSKQMLLRLKKERERGEEEREVLLRRVERMEEENREVKRCRDDAEERGGLLRSELNLKDEKAAVLENQSKEIDRNLADSVLQIEELTAKFVAANEENEKLRVCNAALKNEVAENEENKFKRGEAEEELSILKKREEKIVKELEKVGGECELVRYKLENSNERLQIAERREEGERKRREELEERIEGLETSLGKARRMGMEGSRLMREVEVRSCQGVAEREKEIERLNRRCSVLSEAVKTLSSEREGREHGHGHTHEHTHGHGKHVGGGLEGHLVVEGEGEGAGEEEFVFSESTAEKFIESEILKNSSSVGFENELIDIYNEVDAGSGCDRGGNVGGSSIKVEKLRSEVKKTRKTKKKKGTKCDFFFFK